MIGLRLITMCYDIIALKFTHLVPGMDVVFGPHLREMVRHADHLLCASRCTRRDLLDWVQSVDERPPATSVIPLAANCGRSSAAVREKLPKLLSQPFLLCVSPLEERKNQQTLCRAYTRLIDWRVSDAPVLVLVGGIGHGGQEIINDMTFDRRLERRVIGLSGCSDADLAALYQGCLFTLYHSSTKHGSAGSEGLA